MKPRILISGTAGKMVNYILAVEKSGGAASAVYAPDEFDGYDGLILAGGGDITPELYGEVNAGLCIGMDPKREASDSMAVDAFVKAGKPILGICRGMQIINVLFGGNMIQDLGEYRKTHTPESREDKYHLVNTKSDTFLSELYGENLEANSSHHQAVNKEAEDFIVAAWAEDGTVEALQHKEKAVYGVQWHPERYDGGAKLIEWFVEMCK